METRKFVGCAGQIELVVGGISGSSQIASDGIFAGIYKESWAGPKYHHVADVVSNAANYRYFCAM